MKAVLQFEYDTENHDEIDEIELRLKAGNYKAVLWEVDQVLRQKIKYGNLPEQTTIELEAVRERLYAELGMNNITLD